MRGQVQKPHRQSRKAPPAHPERERAAGAGAGGAKRGRDRPTLAEQALCRPQGCTGACRAYREKRRPDAGSRTDAEPQRCAASHLFNRAEGPTGEDRRHPPCKHGGPPVSDRENRSRRGARRTLRDGLCPFAWHDREGPAIPRGAGPLLVMKEGRQGPSAGTDRPTRADRSRRNRHSGMFEGIIWQSQNSLRQIRGRIIHDRTDIRSDNRGTIKIPERGPIARLIRLKKIGRAARRHAQPNFSAGPDHPGIIIMENIKGREPMGRHMVSRSRRFKSSLFSSPFSNARRGAMLKRPKGRAVRRQTLEPSAKRSFTHAPRLGDGPCKPTVRKFDLIEDRRAGHWKTFQVESRPDKSRRQSFRD